MVSALRRGGHTVRAVVRNPSYGSVDGGEIVEVGDVGPATDWKTALGGIEGVVHLAARVHVMRAVADSLGEFRRVNVEGTHRLAIAAAAAGVGRMVFVSSIKVNGDETGAGPFTERDSPAPRGPYGVSKWEAEQVLKQVGEKTGMETVIIRPPLVYGPGVKGNFLSLLRFCDKAIPLPLAAVRNTRSLIYLGNLIDALGCVLSHPAAAGRTFLVRDGEDLSTPDLIRRTSAALRRSARLFAVPTPLLRFAAALAGHSTEADRLLGSLVVDDGSIRDVLGWRPPFSVAEGLGETAAWFRSVSGEVGGGEGES
ncbi:MAG: NAD-dependent epimerase/dehydratase family protein [Rhodospirillales bacterium]|nr:NAD-dependent epimerase/dehydratase family protein [Rhodospirillales bacterium]